MSVKWKASQSLMSDSVWMLKYLQMSFAHRADLPWAVFKPSGLLLNVIVRHRNCTQMIRSEGHSVPLFMCSWIQEVSEKVYYNKVQKSFFFFFPFFPFFLPKGCYNSQKDLRILLKTITPSDELKHTIEWHQAFLFSFQPEKVWYKRLSGEKQLLMGTGLFGGVVYLKANNQTVAGWAHKDMSFNLCAKKQYFCLVLEIELCKIINFILKVIKTF